MSDDHSRIRVGTDEVGLMGLQHAMESIAATHADKSDDEIEQSLMEMLSAKNYIPTSAKAQYGKAFLREFKKFTGRPYEESCDDRLKIVLVGPGCFQCSQLEQTIIQVLTEMALPASFEHITDLKEIAKLGIIQTPTLIINDRVVAKGVVPTAKKIKAWLIERTNS
jgi:small redox-active disulfide protein 2